MTFAGNNYRYFISRNFRRAEVTSLHFGYILGKGQNDLWLFRKPSCVA